MRYIYPVILLLLFLRFDCVDDKIANDDFREDLSSENNRIWGELYLFVFNGDLDSLTYDYYINYLDSTEEVSAEGLSDKIRAADSRLLVPEDTTFWIFLYYKNDNLILGDNACTDTGTADTAIIYTDKTNPPDLARYASGVTGD